jgi:hypothetical protein
MNKKIHLKKHVSKFFICIILLASSEKLLCPPANALPAFLTHLKEYVIKAAHSIISGAEDVVKQAEADILQKFPSMVEKAIAPMITEAQQAVSKTEGALNRGVSTQKKESTSRQ